MKPQLCTSIEQSRRLLSIGVDPKTADMCIITYPNGDHQAYVGQVTINAGTIYTNGELQAENIDLKGEPTWSLSALISLLPMSIDEDDIRFSLRLESYPDEDDSHRWCIDYHNEVREISACYKEAPTPIEACVRMIEWFAEDKHPINKI